MKSDGENVRRKRTMEKPGGGIPGIRGRKMIDRMVALSGLTKQEYILRKLMDWEVTVQGNPRVYKALKNQMQQIYGELKRLEACSEENEELLQTIQMVAETLNGMKEEPQHVEFPDHP